MDYRSIPRAVLLAKKENISEEYARRVGSEVRRYIARSADSWKGTLYGASAKGVLDAAEFTILLSSDPCQICLVVSVDIGIDVRRLGLGVGLLPLIPCIKAALDV